MAELSYNSIFDGVTLALRRAFPAVRIHGRTVKQDLHPGDFNVLPVIAQHSSQLGTRASRSVTFDIIYYATEQGGREECLEKAALLPDAVGLIVTPQGDRVHGVGFDTTIEDDVLHCIVRYSHFVYRPSVEESAEEIKMKMEAFN